LDDFSTRSQQDREAEKAQTERLACVKR